MELGDLHQALPIIISPWMELLNVWLMYFLLLLLYNCIMFWIKNFQITFVRLPFLWFEWLYVAHVAIWTIVKIWVDSEGVQNTSIFLL